MVKISDVLDRNTVIPSLKSVDKPEVIKELAEGLTREHPGINNERLIEVLTEREKLCSTALDSGVAIPHAKLSGISDILLGFGRSEKGVDFDSLDKKSTHFFILLVSPENTPRQYIELLARISMIFKDSEFRSRLMNAESREELYEYIISEDEKLG
jgi:nitrogen PTS system EIIA component